MTVGDIIAEPLETLRPDIAPARRRPLAIDWLEKLGLTADMADRYPSEFSGGQAQRIAIERKSVVYGKSVSVRVDLGGCRLIKKKQRRRTTKRYHHKKYKRRTE